MSAGTNSQSDSKYGMVRYLLPPPILYSLDEVSYSGSSATNISSSVFSTGSSQVPELTDSNNKPQSSCETNLQKEDCNLFPDLRLIDTSVDDIDSKDRLHSEGHYRSGRKDNKTAKLIGFMSPFVEMSNDETIIQKELNLQRRSCPFLEKKLCLQQTMNMKSTEPAHDSDTNEKHPSDKNKSEDGKRTVAEHFQTSISTKGFEDTEFVKEVSSRNSLKSESNINKEQDHVENKATDVQVAHASKPKSRMQIGKNKKVFVKERLKSIRTAVSAGPRKSTTVGGGCLLMREFDDSCSFAQSEPIDTQTTSVWNADVKSDDIVIPRFCRPTIYRVYAKAAHRMEQQKKHLELMQIASPDSEVKMTDRALDAGKDSTAETEEEVEKTKFGTCDRKTSDEDIVAGLGETVKIIDSNNSLTEEFLNYFYLVIKRKLIEEYNRISVIAPTNHINSIFSKDPTWHPTLTSLEYMVEGMLKEIDATYENKCYKLDKYREKDNLMSGVLTHLNDIICEDRALTTDDIEGINIENMRRETMIWNFATKNTLSKSPETNRSKFTSQVRQNYPLRDDGYGGINWRHYFRKKQIAQPRQKFEANLRKTIELGFLSEESGYCPTSAVDPSSSASLNQIVLILKSDAIRQGEDAGARLWNMATKKIISELDEREDFYQSLDVSMTQTSSKVKAKRSSEDDDD